MAESPRGASMLTDAGLSAIVGVSDLGGAAVFYGGVLGLDVSVEEPFAVVSAHGGAQLRLTRVARVAPAPYSVLGWRVDDIHATVRDLHSRGVRTIRYDGMEQDADDVWIAPDGTGVAWFTDPDGNLLSVVGPA